MEEITFCNQFLAN